MKIYSFVLIFFFAGFTTLSVAQNTATAQDVNKYAMELDDYTLLQLQSTTWHCEDRQVMEDGGYWNRTTPFTLRFMDNQRFMMNDGKRFVEGTWEVINGSEMNFIVSPEQENDLDKLVQKGLYYIYKVTHQTMVMHKKLASADDYQHFFRFYSENTHNYVQGHKDAGTLPIPSGRTRNTNPTDEEVKQAVLARLRSLALTKDLNTAKDIETMSLQELKKVLEDNQEGQ